MFRTLNVSLFATNEFPTLTLDAKSVYISIVVDEVLVAAMATWSVPVTVVTPTIYDPLISDNDDVKPDITTKSPLLKLWLFVGVIRRVSLSSFVMTASLYFNTSVTILVIGSPLIESTFAIIPSP